MGNNKKVLFQVRNLQKYFQVKKKTLFSKEEAFVHANESITLDIYEGETLGLVGESGCGKSTFGRTLIQLYSQTDGSTLYYGSTLYELAPVYVKEVIRNISKDYPQYMALVGEVEELARKKEAATGEEWVSLDETLYNKNKEIENNYRNMVRIAGGLLVHEDLGKVTELLLKYHEEQVDVAKLRREVELARTELTDPSVKDKKDQVAKIESAIASLKERIASEEKDVEQIEKEVESLRSGLSTKNGFAELEAQRDDGIDLSRLSEEEMRRLRKDLQIIFQDPYSSLDTRMTVGQIIGEGVTAHGIFKNDRSEEYNAYIQSVMAQCGLAPYFIHRYPHQFSGGQRQRIGIARALALKPKFIVCDEAVSALDVSIQSQVINLLQDLKDANNLTYLFITHDLSVVKYISDRIGVMYLGHIVELATSDEIFANPLHPYTQALMEAIPRTDVADKELYILEGDIPSAVNPPEGCRFHTRCKHAMDRCRKFEPVFKDVGNNHFVACHLMDLEEGEEVR